MPFPLPGRRCGNENQQPSSLPVLLHPGQQSDIFLHAEPADETQHHAGVGCITVAPVGTEQLGVDAALHQVTRPSRFSLQQLAKLRIGSKQNIGAAIEPGYDSQRRLLNAVCTGSRARLAKPVKQPVRTRRRVFVHVRVPRCGQRHTQILGEQRSQDSQFAGPRDVNNVRPKRP